ncbi:MAG: DUF4139 domain-containing protein [Planctomycetota bacterium]|jgi:hypothetical protein
MKHLTEPQLIEYQFDLANENQAKDIAAHLKACSDCREHLEQLKMRFESLNLLREEPQLSEDLISTVMQQVQHSQKPQIKRFPIPAWLGAAAAVLVMASLLLVSELKPKRTPTVTKEPPKTITSTEPKTEAVSMISLDKGDAEDKMIPEKPPFAPASAIELVVLPRRENVQLTIYNSTFKSAPIPVPMPTQQAKPTGGYGGYGGTGGYGGGYGGRGGYGARSSGYGGRQRSATTQSQEQLETRIYDVSDLVGRGGHGGGYGGRGGYGGMVERIGSIAGGDITLVREKRKLTLKKGWNWLQFMWANTKIDPTSLNLEPMEQKDKIQVQELVFPARLRELGRWLIRSEVSGQAAFEITYFTTGITWRAFYMGTLTPDERKMKLTSYVKINNKSGEDYENAQTRLIVGNVHILDKIADLASRQYPHGLPPMLELEQSRKRPKSKGGMMGGMGGMGGYGGARGGYGGGGYGGGIAFRELKPKEIVKEGLSEYFLYAIEGTETIPNQWAKRLQSFEQDEIDVNSLYKYDEDRYAAQTTRFLSFKNDEDHNLGQTPLPDGTVKIFNITDKQGYLSYVGTTNVKYIPVGEKVELNLGPARLVTVKPKLMNFETKNYLFNKDKDIIGFDEIRTWKVEITNTRTLPIEIEITRNFGTNYWSLEADIDYKQHDVTRARFKLNIEPRTKKVFNYTVTTYHGQRQIEINQ